MELYPYQSFHLPILGSILLLLDLYYFVRMYWLVGDNLISINLTSLLLILWTLFAGSIWLSRPRHTELLRWIYRFANGWMIFISLILAINQGVSISRHTGNIEEHVKDGHQLFVLIVWLVVFVICSVWCWAVIGCCRRRRNIPVQLQSSSSNTNQMGTSEEFIGLYEAVQRARSPSPLFNFT